MQSDSPEDGHTFRITVVSRGSYAVEGVPGHKDAEWLEDDPFEIEVRAWDLKTALLKAVCRPLHEWLPEEKDD